MEYSDVNSCAMRLNIEYSNLKFILGRRVLKKLFAIGHNDIEIYP